MSTLSSVLMQENKIAITEIKSTYKGTKFFIVPLGFSAKTELECLLYNVSKDSTGLNLMNKEFIYQLLLQSISDEEGKLVFSSPEEKTILKNAMSAQDSELVDLLDECYNTALRLNKFIMPTTNIKENEIKN